MNEYYECQNCGQVVPGWNASQSVECCDTPDYEPVSEPASKPSDCPYCS